MNVGSWKRGNMQLKFSKKSLSKDNASSFGGSALKTLLMKRSLKISGFQYIHLLSSVEDDKIISWKDESPVFSLTHWMPLGEKIEKPDDDPTSCQLALKFRGHVL
jgi:hypothetical protein